MDNQASEERFDADPGQSLSTWLSTWLCAPVDASSLSFLRIALGALVSFGAMRFMAKGWIHELLVVPQHRFHYYGFGWVPRPTDLLGEVGLGEAGCYALLSSVAVLGALVALGVCYRLSVTLLFIAFTWVELLDVSTYLNHYYLISCLLLLMSFLPAPKMWTLGKAAQQADASARQLPRWMLMIVRAQIGLVYVFAGLAKLKSDWLFSAEPLQTWLQARAELPIIGGALTWSQTAYVFSWAGALYDLTIVGWLLWRPTRAAAYLAVIAFHLLTGLLFNIGLFPLAMIALSTVFFEPDWARRWMRAVGATESKPPEPRAAFRLPKVAWVAGAFVALQLLFPLRQWVYPGNPLWTEQGYRFAWNVMLMEKTGHVDFRVRDPATGRQWITSGRSLLTPLQHKVMRTQPDLILQFAHLLAQHYQTRYGIERAQVFADAWASLNGRPRQRLLDPSVDLAAETDGLAPKSWIVASAE